jgi:hypothetical protein
MTLIRLTGGVESEDGIGGGPGNDRINGGNDPDTIFGDFINDSNILANCGNGYRSDQIAGGSGNNEISHGLGTPE